jgi:hypothetical protein
LPAGDSQRPTRVGASDGLNEGEWIWQPEAEGGFNFWNGGPGASGAVAGRYHGWANGQPNNSGGQEHCSAVLAFDGPDGDAGEWNDVECEDDYPFVCETP